MSKLGSYIRRFINWLLGIKDPDNGGNDQNDQDHNHDEFEDKRVYITSDEVRQIIKNALGAKLKTDVRLADLQYYCPSVEYTKHVMEESDANEYAWTSEIFDCDDFAFILKADFCKDAYRNRIRRAPHCFGIIWGLLPGPHAINWVINDDKKFRFVEPQNDTIYDPSDTEKEAWMMIA